ncbi:Glycosyl transferase [Carpediemonas membranifera]|uniref:Glycosyl transferase n=1 Tax=Carpediemonas membranifera TaxID=201153 RepID=A0A8J6AQB3_9EUKA|nr:Glycosyl transferase [Carpediemonas membranifera]|eukprot:KAG9391216.1 Glycosyl transferase [Carpediemonas membranifera]
MTRSMQNDYSSSDYSSDYSSYDSEYDSEYDSSASGSSSDGNMAKLKQLARLRAMQHNPGPAQELRQVNQQPQAVQSQPIQQIIQPAIIAPSEASRRIVHYSSKMSYDEVWDYTQEFFGRCNDRIKAKHRAAFARDESIRWLHLIWLAAWGITVGTIVAIVLIYPGLLADILDYSTYGYFLFTAIEYALILRSLKTAVYDPPIVLEEEEEVQRLPKGKVCLMLAFGWNTIGLSDEEKAKVRDSRLAAITDSIEAAGRVFEPQDIFVVHNSNDVQFDEEDGTKTSALPDTVVQEFLRGKAVYAGLEIANKSVAVYYCAELVDRLGYEYSIVMDDDCEVPPQLTEVLRGNLEDDAYCFAITAARSNESFMPQLLANEQAIEYALSDLAKISQAAFSPKASVLSPHGAANMWKAHLLPQVMAQHNCIFDGEDYQMGKILREKFPKGRMSMISSCHVPTNVPTAIRALTRQRKNSWDLAAHQFLCGGLCGSPHTAEYLQVILCLPFNIRNMVLRVYTAQDVWTAIQDYFRVPLLVWYMWKTVLNLEINLWVVASFALMFITQWTVAFSFQHFKVKNRPELQMKGGAGMTTMCCLAFPFYRFYLSFVRVASLLTYLFSYQSIKRTAIPVAQTGVESTLPEYFTLEDIPKRERRHPVTTPSLNQSR